MGKQMVLYLADSTIDGIVDIEVINWAGKVLKIPRNELENDFWPSGAQAGVYFLMSIDEQTGEDAVYIGESTDVKKRLKQHIADYSRGKERFYWHTAVVFVGRQLNKSHIQYMENVLKQQAQISNNYQVLTKATTSVKTDAGTRDSCNQFIAEIKMLLGLLKYKIYDEPQSVQVNQSNMLFCKDSKGAEANGYVSANGFTVVRGSKVSPDVVYSFVTHPYYALRRKLEESGIIENGVFTKDCDEFKAPSAASSVVLGRSSNGNTDWKNVAGIPLKDLK